MEWISVDDRLPDMHKDVLCYAHDCGESYQTTGACIFDNGTFVGWESQPLIVSHWMPLPEPPERPETPAGRNNKWDNTMPIIEPSER